MSELEQVSAASRGKRLRTIRNILGISIEQFAELCGVGESTIRFWEQGKGSGLSVKGAHKVISSIFTQNVQCSVDWLLYGTGEEPSNKSLHDEKARSNPLFSKGIISNDISQIKKDIDNFLTLSPNAIVHGIQDDAMAPLLFIGDYIGGYSVEPHNFERLIDQVAIIKIHENDLIVRKILRHNTDNTYSVCCLNTKTKMVDSIIKDVNIISMALICRVWRIPQLLSY